LSELIKISQDNKKNLSKAIMALWKLFSMDVLVGDWKETFGTFNDIQNTIEALKNNLEEEYKKTNADSVKKTFNNFLNY
jgi:hypothetical protein